jgi:hypothetical protein
MAVREEKDEKGTDEKGKDEKGTDEKGVESAAEIKEEKKDEIFKKGNVTTHGSDALLSGKQIKPFPMIPITKKGWVRMAGDCFTDKSRYPNVPMAADQGKFDPIVFAEMSGKQKWGKFQISIQN